MILDFNIATYVTQSSFDEIDKFCRYIKKSNTYMYARSNRRIIFTLDQQFNNKVTEVFFLRLLFNIVVNICTNLV